MTATITETLPAVECTPWCEDGAGHSDAWHPGDQWCRGPLYVVKMTRMPLEHYTHRDGTLEHWLDDVRVSLQKERKGQPYVSLNRGENGGVALTLTEARELRDHLTALLTDAVLSS
jgi:hypothetical protein